MLAKIIAVGIMLSALRLDMALSSGHTAWILLPAILFGFGGHLLEPVNPGRFRAVAGLIALISFGSCIANYPGGHALEIWASGILPRIFGWPEFLYAVPSILFGAWLGRVAEVMLDSKQD